MFETIYRYCGVADKPFGLYGVDCHKAFHWDFYDNEWVNGKPDDEWISELSQIEDILDFGFVIDDGALYCYAKIKTPREIARRGIHDRNI